MDNYYRTRQDDRLDQVCYQWYGRIGGYVEMVLASNPGLAEYGCWLPSGIEIKMPEAVVAFETDAVRLWN